MTRTTIKMSLCYVCQQKLKHWIIVRRSTFNSLRLPQNHTFSGKRSDSGNEASAQPRKSQLSAYFRTDINSSATQCNVILELQLIVQFIESIVQWKGNREEDSEYQEGGGSWERTGTGKTVFRQPGNHMACKIVWKRNSTTKNSPYFTYYEVMHIMRLPDSCSFKKFSINASKFDN